MKTVVIPEPLRSALVFVTLSTSAGIVSGCGVAAPCSGTNVASVSPAIATADHMSIAPGDQQRFAAFSQFKLSTNSSGCDVPLNILKLTPTWTVSDTINVKISSSQDATNGLATCVGATKSPVTVTALGSAPVGGVPQTLSTATLTCK